MSSIDSGRRARRDSVFRLAHIVDPQGEIDVTSRARNISDTGACIDLVDGVEPEMMLRVTIGKQPPVKARVAWVSDRQFGIVFAAKPKAPATFATQAAPQPVTAKAGWMADLRDGHRR